MQSIALGAGRSHTCAVIGGGAVWSGATISMVSLATALALGASHTCTLPAGGVAQCWGENGYGQLGSGSTTDWSTPIGVGLIGSLVALGSGPLA